MASIRLSYLFALCSISVSQLVVTASSEEPCTTKPDRRKVGGFQLHTTHIALQEAGCTNLMRDDGFSLDDCADKAWDIAGNMFTFNHSRAECYINTCDLNLLNNTSIANIDDDRGTYVFDRSAIDIYRRKRQAEWKPIASYGLGIVKTMIDVGANIPISSAIIFGGIGLMINMLDNTDSTYDEIQREVLNDIRNEIAADKVEDMKGQLHAWRKSKLFDMAKQMNIGQITVEAFRKVLLTWNTGSLLYIYPSKEEFEMMIDMMDDLHLDVETKDYMFRLTHNSVSSLAYYHDYAAFEVYLLSLLIIARGHLPFISGGYTAKLKQSSATHYNYLMYTMGKRLIFDGDVGADEVDTRKEKLLATYPVQHLLDLAKGQNNAVDERRFLHNGDEVALKGIDYKTSTSNFGRVQTYRTSYYHTNNWLSCWGAGSECKHRSCPGRDHPFDKTDGIVGCRGERFWIHAENRELGERIHSGDIVALLYGTNNNRFFYVSYKLGNWWAGGDKIVTRSCPGRRFITNKIWNYCGGETFIINRSSHRSRYIEDRHTVIMKNGYKGNYISFYISAGGIASKRCDSNACHLQIYKKLSPFAGTSKPPKKLGDI